MRKIISSIIIGVSGFLFFYAQAHEPRRKPVPKDFTSFERIIPLPKRPNYKVRKPRRVPVPFDALSLMLPPGSDLDKWLKPPISWENMNKSDVYIKLESGDQRKVKRGYYNDYISRTGKSWEAFEEETTPGFLRKIFSNDLGNGIIKILKVKFTYYKGSPQLNFSALCKGKEKAIVRMTVFNSDNIPDHTVSKEKGCKKSKDVIFFNFDDPLKPTWDLVKFDLPDDHISLIERLKFWK